MGNSNQLYIIVALLTAFGGIIGYFCKQFFQRLENVADKSATHLTDPQVRTILDDKLLPIKEDVAEIKDTIHTLIEATLNVSKQRRTTYARRKAAASITSKS